MRTPVETVAKYAPMYIPIRGQVVFTRIASQYTMEEIAKQNEEAKTRAQIYGNRPIMKSKPYTKVSIKNPTFVDGDVAVPEEVKAVIKERFYVGKNDGATYYSIESKSPYLPNVAYDRDAGDLAGTYLQDKNSTLSGELAVGLDITLVVNLYRTNMGSGLGIGYILLHEPVRYYSNNPLDNYFSNMGIEVKHPENTEITPVKETEFYDATQYLDQEQVEKYTGGMKFTPPNPVPDAPAQQFPWDTMTTTTTNRSQRFY